MQTDNQVKPEARTECDSTGSSPARCSVRTLNRRGRWLLTYAAEIQPLMVCTTLELPCFDHKDLPDMGTLNGLVRRGWMIKAHPGIYKLTEAGIKAAASLKAPNAKLRDAGESGVEQH